MACLRVPHITARRRRILRAPPGLLAGAARRGYLPEMALARFLFRFAPAALLLAACGNGGGDGSCPNDLPMSCPADPPHYAATVAPIVKARCATCHAPGGEEASRPLDTYAEVFAQRSEVLHQVYACKMPPAGETQLSADERSALLAWLVCGAPDD